MSVSGFRRWPDNVRRGTALAALLITVAVLRLHAAPGPPGVSYTGSFAQDNERRVFYVTLAAAGTFRTRTFSYAGGLNSAGTTIPAGGFDTTLSVYDAAGNLVAHNEDGNCPTVAADPVTALCWDAFVTVSLPAGNYIVLLTQGDNLPNGPSLSDGFVYDGTDPADTQFSQAPTLPLLFWDDSAHRRTGDYAVDIFGASATEITTITSAGTLPRGVAGQSYGPFTFTAQTGPSATLAWSVVGGSLPTGLALNPATGVLSGAPASPGVYSFTLQATDGIQPVTQLVTITVYIPLTVISAVLPPGQVGQSYGPFPASSTGGSGTVTWSASGLPAGLSISPSGSISGAPTVSGAFNITLNATDIAASLSASVSLNLTVSFAALQITSAVSLGEFVPSSNVAGTLTASGGNPPFTWSATGLPLGFSLNATSGAFSGAAPAPGNYTFSVKLTDSQATPATATVTVTFSVLGLVSTTLAPGTTTAPYSKTFSAIGGTAPYVFTSANLPGGLTLSAGGILGGTPTSVGNFGFTVLVTDATKLSSPTAFNLVVTGPATPLTSTGGAVTGGAVSAAYTGALQASGGTPPYTWSLSGGALPDGLSLAASGSITGTPKTAGISTFGALVTDSASAKVSATFTITITAPTLTLSSLTTFPVGIVGSDYPLQILSAAGGTPPYAYALSTGKLPDGLTFATPQFNGIPTAAGTFPFTITVTDGAGKTAQGSGSILINTAHADLIISQSTVPFALTIGSSGAPTPANVTVRSSVIQQLLNYTVTVAPAAPWLTVTSNAATTTPGAVGIAINPSALSLATAGSPYTTTVSVNCVAPSPCAGNTQAISVSLDVSAPPPQLSITSNLVTFQTNSSNAGPISKPLGIQNTGGGTLTINSVKAADSWLTVTGAPASLQAGPVVNLAVTTNSTGLSAGFYTSSIAIDTSAGVQTVPVSLLIIANLTMSLGPAGSQFQAPTGSAPGNSGGSFNVSVAGGSTASWGASVPPGSAWLSVATPSGTATNSTPGVVSFAIDPAAAAALTPNTYYGTVRVTSSEVVDSPLDYGVVLNVTPATTPVKPNPSPGGVVFLASAAGTTLAAQTVNVFASSGTALPYQASTATTDGAAWLLVTPPTGATSAKAPGKSSISVNTTGLKTGVYRGSVSYAFSSAAVRSVNVTLVVGATSAPAFIGTNPLAGCVPTKLVPTQIGLVDNFEQPVGWPAPLLLFVVTDCGGSVPGAQVTATFSNGDPPLTLTPIDNSSGIFSATWTPRAVSPQVTINAEATTLNLSSGTAQVTGQVSANSAPLLAPNATLNIFTSQLGAAVAPGTIVQIYGSNMASAAAPSTTEPLTTTLGGTSVLIGGIASPLYYVSPTQVNAQVPFELAPGNQYQIQVNAGGALSTPSTIQLAAGAPGVASFPTTGLIIAQHLDYSLVTEASPAKPGEYVIIYLAGLGATDTAVVTGAASPASPLAHPKLAPTLTLNGAPVTVAFVGLTPGAVGLYQINFVVPADTADGDLQLAVGQSGALSNTAILPVKK